MFFGMTPRTTLYLLQNAEQIYIQSDPESGFVGGYGRSLGLVWVYFSDPGITIDILNSNSEVVKTENLSGWILINYHLILNGYSRNTFGGDSTIAFDNRYLYRWFQEAEKSALENGFGIHE